MTMEQILIPKKDLTLKYAYKLPEKAFAYLGDEEPSAWQFQCRKKLRELIVCDLNFGEREIVVHHETRVESGVVYSLIMHADETLSMPAYLFVPDEIKIKIPAIAIQGHGYVLGVLGLHDDYHHGFGVDLFHAGAVVLVPEIRGFGDLVNLSADVEKRGLVYYNWGELMAFTLVTDAFLKGYTLIGDTVQDLFAWGTYLCKRFDRETYSLAGISYGGDLAVILAALDERVAKTFASGTLGSMKTIFEKCYNAPAHCVPGILKYMDRQEIASCIAPRSLCIHYGALDVPSPDNSSAAYNETVMPVYDAVKHFYKTMGAVDNVQLIISENMGHEMDNCALTAFLQDTQIHDLNASNEL